MRFKPNLTQSRVASKAALREALELSDERRHILGDLASEYAYVLVVEPSGTLRCEWSTDLFQQIMGTIPADEDAKSLWISHLHTDDLPLMLDHWRNLLAGQSDSCEFRLMGTDGEMRWIHENCRALRQPNEGRVIRIYGMGQDITPRVQLERELSAYRRLYRNHLYKMVDEHPNEWQLANEILNLQATERERMETVLRESERRYRQLVEEASDAVYTTDLSGAFTFVNASGVKLTGYSANELIGMRFSDLVLPGWANEIEQAYIAQFQNHVKETTLEFPILTRYGKMHWIEQTVTLLSSDGKITGFQGIVRDITKRKQAEEALRVSEARNRALVNAIPDPMMTLSESGTILDYRGHKDSDPVSVNELVGKSVREVYPAAVADQFVTYVQHALHRNTVQIWEYQLELLGQVYDYEARIVVCGEHEALSIVRDITERKRTEKEFRNATLRLATLIESLQTSILVEDESRHIALVNQNFCDMFHIPGTTQELIGYDCSNIPEQVRNLFLNPDAFIARINQVLWQRRVVTSEEVKMADGRVLERDFIPIFLGEDYRGHLWQYRDITGRKQAEEALRQGEERLRRITDNMLDMIFQTDVDGVIEYMSPSCWSILGYAPDELLGNPLELLIHGDDVAYVKEAVQTVDRVEYRCLHAAGNYLWMETISNLLFEDDGRVSGIVYASRDISKRKQAEQKLQELNQLKTEFLSTAAHELRTPLTSIRGFSEILLTRQLDETRQKRYVTLINEQSNQLGAIIDDLLDVSRLEAGRGLKMSFEPVDMRILTQEVMAIFIDTAPHHQLRQEGLLEGGPLVKGDPIRLAQVCKNLLSNAIKYSPSGGNVAITGRIVDNFLEIGIQDEGIGMTLEQQTHLFEKFYRANASNTAITGTGLGLAITKLIIELHGGKIWVTSEYGVGTTVHFTVPLHTADDGA